jgi:hypothetical protein
MRERFTLICNRNSGNLCAQDRADVPQYDVDEFVAAESLEIQSGTPSLNKHAVIV